jgi:hypothetical protein
MRPPIPPVRIAYLVTWLRDNRETFTAEELRLGLVAAGHDPADVDTAMAQLRGVAAAGSESRAAPEPGARYITGVRPRMDTQPPDATMTPAPPARARPGVRGWVGSLILGVILVEILVFVGTLLLGSLLPGAAIALVAFFVATFAAGKAVGLRGARWWVVAGVLILVLNGRSGRGGCQSRSPGPIAPVAVAPCSTTGAR